MLTAQAQMPSLLGPITTQIGTGDIHTCALATDGTVQCWGDNSHGQLGNGTLSGSSTPVVVTGLSGVATITAGYGSHSCALTQAGAVQCWGANGYGQLGNGTTADSSTPFAVTGLSSGVAAISAGQSYTCALTTAGTVKCWGRNGSGQLGNGTTANSATPVLVTGLSSGVIAIVAGAAGQTCALTTAGAVQCWGYNPDGELGNGTTANSTTPVAVTGLSGSVMALAAGGGHTCALIQSGAVQCWGYGANGQLGNGANAGSTTPVTVTGLAGAIAITAGEFHSCAVTHGDAAFCWGANGYGQLGNGTGTGSSTPVAVSGLSSGAAAISAGLLHTCILTQAGAVQCWGSDASGQLGNGTFTNSAVPVAVTLLASGVSAIAPSYGYTCALTQAGAVQCWGVNTYGQLGNGTTANSLTPVMVTGLASGATAVATNEDHVCALTRAGAVQCWGYNGEGELGNGTTTNSAAPVAVTGLSSGVTAIAVGGGHTCALTQAGAVQCWGYNVYGQLGNGTTVNSATPVAVTGLSGGAVAIAAGYHHTCALTQAGAVQCWGDNSSDQLGNGTTANSATPVAVTGLTSGVVAISAGKSQTCALTTTGAMLCWGDNSSGQLGNGTTTNSAAPVAVTGLSSGVAKIAAGLGHTCALTQANAVQCWGYNGDGELGNGTTANSTTPVAVTGLSSNVTAVATGGSHTCTLTQAGVLQCWGYNFDGALGNGTTTSSSVPVSIQIAQSIGFAPQVSVVSGATLTLSATANGGAVGFDTWTPTACSVSGTTLTATASALCGVRASQAGGADGQGGTLSPAPQQLRLIRITAAVTPAATTLAITAHTPDPVSLGQSITVTTSLSVIAPGTGTPTGTITIGDGTVSCSFSTPANSSCQITPTAAGTKTLTASYSGDVNFAASTSSGVSETVDLPAIAGACGSDSGGMFATLTAIDPNLCRVGTVSAFAGSGPWTWSCLGANGGAAATCSASKAATAPTATTITLTLSPNPATVNQPVTVAVNVTGQAGAAFAPHSSPSNIGKSVIAPAAAPVGTVSITGGGVSCGTIVLDANGSGQCSASFATPGTYTLTANYPGGAGYAASTGGASIRIDAAAQAQAVVSAPALDHFGVLCLIFGMGVFAAFRARRRSH